MLALVALIISQAFGQPGPLPTPANPPAVAPPPALSDAKEKAAEAGYSFNPLAVKRDPFTPPEPNAGKIINDLERFDLNQMSLVAILSGLGQPQAMIVLPDGKTHIVQVGDVVGKRSGKVSKITHNEVVVKETFKDFQSRVKTDLTSLYIAE